MLGKIPSYGYMVGSEIKAKDSRDLFTYAGDADPKFTGGIINTFKINNFDFTISAAFNLKQTVMRKPSYNSALIDPGRNYSKEVLNMWTPINTSGTMPGLTGNDPYDGTDNWMLTKWFDDAAPIKYYNYLDIWAKETSYIRISSLRLGYTLPKAVLDKLRLENVRFTVEGRNLFVFGTNYNGYFDPETYGNIYAQPIQRSFSLGLNVTF